MLYSFLKISSHSPKSILLVPEIYLSGGYFSTEIIVFKISILSCFGLFIKSKILISFSLIMVSPWTSSSIFDSSF